MGYIKSQQPIPLTQKAAANGVATLNSGSLIPDNQISSNIARLDTFQQFTTTQRVGITSGDISGSYTINLSTNMHSYTLTGDVTSLSATGMQAGATYVIYLSEDATGGRTLSFNTDVFKALSGETLALPNTTANKRFMFSCSCLNGTTLDCSGVRECS